MDNTVSVNVTYSVTSEAQRKLLEMGKPAQSAQRITLEIPRDHLSEFPITIDKDGTVHLSLKEPHYTDYGYGKPSDLRDCSGVKCEGCGKSAAFGALSEPVFSLDDVRALFARNQADESAVTTQITHKNELKQIREQVTTEVTAQVQREMDAKYDAPVKKIAAIREIINGKNRVRTAQIAEIIG